MTAALALKRSAAAPSTSLVEGEFPFTQEDFAQIAAMLYEDSGIYLTEGKVTLVYSRLAKRVRTLGLASFRDYCEIVSSDSGAEERWTMLSALTTNLTRFFREPHHFDHFRDHTLAALIEHARAGGRIRFWSAGCSSGEEPYSMALALLSVLPEAAELDVRILATDIDPIIVARAREGLYGEEAVSAIPQELRRSWLKREGEGSWRMGEAVRGLIAFNELNLMGQWPMKGRFEAIFCRNVAIYFDEPTQERLWGRFAGALAPQGRLYIGHSERIGVAGFETDGLTTYKLAGARR